jgi:hypothetical protein
MLFRILANKAAGQPHVAVSWFHMLRYRTIRCWQGKCDLSSRKHSLLKDKSMRKTLIILTMLLGCCQGAHSREVQVPMIEKIQNIFSDDWKKIDDKNWIYAKEVDGKLIGYLAFASLFKAASEESKEMATITEKTKRIKRVLLQDVIAVNESLQINRVFLSLNVEDRKSGISSPMAFYSWYIPSDNKSITIKLRCNIYHAEKLSMEIDNKLKNHL